jgi:hypothetical protein
VKSHLREIEEMTTYPVIIYPINIDGKELIGYCIPDFYDYGLKEGYELTEADVILSTQLTVEGLTELVENEKPTPTPISQISQKYTHLLINRNYKIIEVDFNI